ncbi:MAG: alpha/beta hydrolase family protein [Acidimicrobiales bacterium]
MITDLGFLLTPGANGSADHPALVALEEALAPAPVHRVALPARRGAERVALDAAALAARTGLAPRRLILGGRSYGGRMCSEAVAAGLVARALVLISYPLHPPGRPAQLRTAHFPAIGVPCLFVSGRGDAFATPQEMAAAVEAVDAPCRVVWLPGGGHGLRGRDRAVVEVVTEWVGGLRD